MFPRFVVCLLGSLALAGSSHAQEAQKLKGVVELFTSQGCSSCPPADAAFRSLVNQGDVVALAYHVDYWNYLGWADTLSSKENTARQYSYARALGRSNVYTPQAIINGRDHLPGADLAAINSKVDLLSDEGKGLQVPVNAVMNGDELKINIGGGQGKANVVVVYFDKETSVDVDKGENSGRKISYLRSVANVETVGMWEGQPLTLALPASVVEKASLDGCAILLQTSTPEGDPGAILGATVVMAGRRI